MTAAALAVAASMAATARLPQSARFSLGDEKIILKNILCVDRRGKESLSRKK